MAIITYFLAAVIQPLSLYLLLGLVMEKRWRNLPLWVHSLLATLALQPPTIIRGLTEQWYDLMSYIQLAVMLGSVIVIFKDKFFVKIFSILLYYLLAIVGETAVFTVLGEWVVGVDPYGNSSEALVIQLAVTIVVYSMYGVVLALWKKFFKREHVPNRFWVFIIFPVSQIFMMNSWSTQLYAGEIVYSNTMEVLMGLLVGFFADAVLFYVLFMQGEKEEIKRRLEETEHVLEMENNYYQSLKLRQEELDKINHDFNNQLTAALNLVETNKEQSQEMLNQLKSTLRRNENGSWSNNPVINAVLQDKVFACEKEKIDFKADIHISEAININSLHLCSIFANLIDNALNASKEYEQTKAYVHVTTNQKGPYLYIKVENASDKPEKKLSRAGHGYGLKIVENIAMQYNGQLQCKWENNVYTALVVLEVQGKNTNS